MSRIARKIGVRSWRNLGIDLVSCKRNEGPFTGTGGFGGSTTEWLRTARLLGIQVPDGGGGATNELSFTTNPTGDTNFMIVKGEAGKRFLDAVPVRPVSSSWPRRWPAPAWTPCCPLGSGGWSIG